MLHVPAGIAQGLLKRGLRPWPSQRASQRVIAVMLFFGSHLYGNPSTLATELVSFPDPPPPFRQFYLDRGAEEGSESWRDHSDHRTLLYFATSYAFMHVINYVYSSVTPPPRYRNGMAMLPDPSSAPPI